MNLKRLPIFNTVSKAIETVKHTKVTHVVTKLENVKVFTNQKDFKYLITIDNEKITVLDSQGNNHNRQFGIVEVQNISRSKSKRKSEPISHEGQSEESLIN